MGNACGADNGSSKVCDVDGQEEATIQAEENEAVRRAEEATLWAESLRKKLEEQAAAKAAEEAAAKAEEEAAVAKAAEEAAAKEAEEAAAAKHAEEEAAAAKAAEESAAAHLAAKKLAADKKKAAKLAADKKKAALKRAADKKKADEEAAKKQAEVAAVEEAKAKFKAIFGETLMGKSGVVKTEDALKGKAGVLIYFSAHWCRPSLVSSLEYSTPKLAEFYKKHAAEKNFEVVFVSGDNDMKSFREYYKEQPWLALPFAQREKMASLNKKYNGTPIQQMLTAQGIPALVVLGPKGELMTTDGRSKVMENFEDCFGFPWKPPSFAEALGETFLKQDGSTVGKEAIAGKTLALYFSAHWCPPCRGFTPELKSFYEAYKAKDPNFEIVFVSSDKDQSQMRDYFKNDHGNYLALPYEKRKAKDDLSTMFGVQGIPSFVVVSADGQTINASARGRVESGAKAVLAAGWEPPAVGDMEEGAEAGGKTANECPAVIILCGQCSDEVQKSIHDALEPLAKRFIAEAKSKDSDPEYIFILAKGPSEEIPIPQFKALAKKEQALAKSNCKRCKPVMILADLPDNGGFYVSDMQDITTANVETFLKSKGKRLQLNM